MPTKPMVIDGALPSGEAAIGARLLLRQLGKCERGRLEVLERGKTIADILGRCAGPHAAIDIKMPSRLLRRLLLKGDIGFAEAYMAGEWDSPDLAQLLLLLTLNLDNLRRASARTPLTRMIGALQHRLNRNTLRGSRRNIAAHYDLGNDFYARWLDDSMTYSAALFDESSELTAAQERKYERILGMLDPDPGDHILEIGCGWGGFAEYAARGGMRVTGVTLSREQLAYAQKRIRAAGLEDRVNLRLADYREIQGRFDHLVSIEMLEAVGQEYWGGYFHTLFDRLVERGRAMLQVITIDEEVFPAYASNPGGFIQRYIFPGGMLPTKSHLRRHATNAMLEPLAMDSFGDHYADTLAHWRQRFAKQTPWLEAHGYDERFRRMWHYYLAFCEAGFRARRIDLVQFLLEKP